MSRDSNNRSILVGQYNSIFSIVYACPNKSSMYTDYLALLHAILFFKSKKAKDLYLDQGLKKENQQTLALPSILLLFLNIR